MALAASGCGKGTGSVSGKVTYQGFALPGGYVSFLSQGEKSVTQSSKIDADGSYKVSGLPVGPAKITVQGESTRKLAVIPGQGGDSQANQPAVTVPGKYSTAEQSGLTCEVKPGSQTHDIDLP